MRLRTFVSALFVALTALTAGAQVGIAPAPAPLPATESLVASSLARQVFWLLRTSPLTVEAIDGALILAQEAADLDPENPERWRLVREIALLADREEVANDAVRRIVALDPNDDVALLQRLVARIDELPTAEERIALYQRMLEDDVREKIGDVVASRLAVDLALLEQQRGNLEGFGEALARAVALDSSNPTAAALAAGFFRANVDDALGEAELLVNLMIADPADIATQVVLAELLLESGAYRAAERIYRLAIRNHAKVHRRASGDLLADQAIAQWAAGLEDSALLTINIRQTLIDEMLHARAREEEPEMDPVTRSRITGSVSPTLATVRAAVLRQRGDDGADAAADRAVRAYEDAIDGIVDGIPFDPPSEAQQATLRLEMALVAIWLGRDPDAVEALVETVESYRPLTDDARAVYEAWMLLRRGDPAGAIERFEAIVDPGVGGKLGLAESYAAAGRRREAAQTYLAIAREQPGSLIGVWSANALMAIVNSRMPLSDVARALEDLVASVPSVFDRFPTTPSLAVEVRVLPRKTLFGPYEPVTIDLEVTNNSPYPLAISPEGPIRPQIIVMFTITSRPAEGSARLPSLVVEIDRRLELKPRERLLIPVDLTEHALGAVLTGNAKEGLFVQGRAVVNYLVREKGGGIEPGLLGDEQMSTAIRVDGARVDVPWIIAALERVMATTGEPDLATLALLLEVAAIELTEDAPADYFRLVAEVRSRLADIFPTLAPIERAWLLSIVKPGDLTRAMREAAAASDERIVRLMYIVQHATSADDPVMVAATEDESDPRLQRLAEVGRFMREAMAQGEGQ